MQTKNAIRINIIDLTEINHWLETLERSHSILAKNPINFKLFKGPTQRMDLRRFRCGLFQLIYAGKEIWRLAVIQAKVFFPVLFGNGGHFTLTFYPCGTAMPSGFQQRTNDRRRGDLAFAAICLVIGFDVIEFVKIVHHHARGLRQTLG